MNYETIKTQLKNNQLNNIYLFYGDEQYLIDSIIKKIEKMVLGENINGMTKNEFRDNFDIQELINAVNTMPMIGNKKVVICRNSELFKGNTKNEQLLKLFDTISKDAYLIFVEKQVSVSNIQYKKLKELKCIYNISIRNNNDIIKYITNTFKKAGKNISINNAYLFLEYSGGYLIDIEKDIEKIILFMDNKKDVKKEYIVNLCQGTKEAKIYELTNYLFKKDKTNSYKVLKELLSEKVPIQIILSVLNNSYMELYKVKLAIENNENPVVLRKNKPIHEYALKMIIKSAKKFSFEQIEKVIKDISDIDSDIKYGNISANIAIELLVLSIV